MKTILKWSIYCLVVSFWGCKKENQYSDWKVNEDTFKSNDIDIAVGKARASFGPLSTENNFHIVFYLGYLPTEGKWLINTGNDHDPFRVFINFYYGSQFYIISPNETSYLEASEVKGKARYYLNPTWYINFDNHDDSVLVEGTFCEP